MARKISPGTMRDYGVEVAHLGISAERAAEIAPEVEALNDTALEAAVQLDFNDEPAQFALALVRNRQPHGKKR